MSDAASARRHFGFGFWSFIVFMLALTMLFVGLGVWQVNRLAEKEALIATVTDRLTLPPYALPPVAEWAALNPDFYQFRPVTTSGRYVDGKTTLVFTSLGEEAKGKYSGPGYWVMTPFVPDTGGTVFVNRGFVPQSSGPSFLASGIVPQGEQTITGVALTPEAAGSFTPGPDKANHIEWIRDPVRLAAIADVSGPVLGVTVDLPAGDPGALPQGGETTVDFPNNHFGYALTWFGFAILTPLLLGFWVWRQVRPTPA